jgi:exodeoxyribonuclease VII large subunit
VRAIAACPVPTISAVGHEVDVTLTDLVADLRAATPTMAGEMAVPVWSDLYDRLTGIERRLGRELGHALRGARQRLAELGERGERRVEGALAARHRALVDVRRRLAAAHPRARLLGDRRAVDAAAARLARAGALALDRRRRALDGLGRRLAAASPASSLERRRAGIAALDARAARALHRGLDERRRRFAAGIARLDALSPLAVLERGYAIATRGGHVVGDAGALAVGDELTIRLARGEVDARVERTRSGRG